MKFKPGLTINFIPRYVQISKRAFRYFRNKSDSYSGRPITSIRKAIIRSAEVIEVNKGSYLKPGSAIAKSGKEDSRAGCRQWIWRSRCLNRFKSTCIRHSRWITNQYEWGKFRAIRLTCHGHASCGRASKVTMKIVVYNLIYSF